MEIYPVDLIFHIINIIVLFVIVRTLAYKPIRKFMLEREARVKAQLDEAEAAKAQAGELQARYESCIADAEKDRDALLAEGHDAAIKESHEIIDAARAQAASIVEDARAQARAQAEKAMSDARGDLANAAVELAGRVLCFNEAARSRAMAMNTAKSGTSTGVLKPAGAADETELKEMTTCLENLTGRNLQLSVELDKSILGGFVGYIDGQVYDFSYLAQLRQAQSRLS